MSPAVQRRECSLFIAQASTDANGVPENLGR